MRGPEATRSLHACPVADFLPHLVALWRERLSSTTAFAGHLTDGELHEAAAAVRELSRGFTRGRLLAGSRYMDDQRLLGGYLLFYWTVSFSQTWAALLSAGFAPASRGRMRILDLGAGPGPSSLALLAMGLGTVTAADRSERSLALARALARRAGLPLQTRGVDLEAGGRLPGGSFDLVTVVHTLNELWLGRDDRLERRVALAESIASRLAPGGRLLIVDPALTRTANEAIELRDALVERGWRVRAPCTWSGRCPALPGGTCHAEAAWEPPATVRRIGHAARIGREKLAFTYFLLEPPNGTEPHAAAMSSDSYRVVSERFLAKSGRLRVLLCGPGGRFPLSMDGAAGFPAARLFRSLGRYDLVRVEAAEQRSTGWGLAPASRLQIVRRAPAL